MKFYNVKLITKGRVIEFNKKIVRTPVTLMRVPETSLNNLKTKLKANSIKFELIDFENTAQKKVKKIAIEKEKNKEIENNPKEQNLNKKDEENIVNEITEDVEISPLDQFLKDLEIEDN